MDKSLESSERGGVFRVWSLPPWIIQSSEEVAEESSIQQVYVEGEGGGCISCGITSPFEDRKAMTDHFRSSLHVLNIRRRMKGLPAVSIETEVEDEEDDEEEEEDDDDDDAEEEEEEGLLCLCC